MASESIHVSSTTVRRGRALFQLLLKLLLPVMGVAAVTAWTTTATWFKTRTSLADVQTLTTECTTIAKDAQGQGNTQKVQIYALQQTVLALAETIVELHAQAEVERAYYASKRLPEYIARARSFYLAEFERQQDAHPNDIVKALKYTRAVAWRPDRN